LSSVYISVVFYQDIGFSVEYINASGEKTVSLLINFQTVVKLYFRIVYIISYSIKYSSR